MIKVELDNKAVKTVQKSIGGGTVGHTLTVQFNTVWEDGIIAEAKYQVFQVALLKYLNGNVVTSVETINDNNEHTFENVIAYTYTYAGDKSDGDPTEELISLTGIMYDIANVYNADTNFDAVFMTQLLTNSNIVVKYIITMPK